LEVGRNIPMFNSSGNVVYGTILEVNDDEVLMDFNHAFAGKTLHFTGEVVSIREATEKELKQELFNLRFQLATGQLEGTARIREVRKQIARIKTALRQEELQK